MPPERSLTDPVGAAELLARAAGAPGGTHSVPAEAGALLVEVVVSGTSSEERAPTGVRVERILGFLRLSGLAREDVLTVVDHYALLEEGTLEAAAENTSLTDEDVAALAGKLWMGSPERAGSVLPGARRRLRGSSRATAAALGALSEAWFDTAARIGELALELGAAEEGAVEVFETLARDAVARGRLSHLDAAGSRALVEQAVLLVRGCRRAGPGRGFRGA